MSYTVVGGDGSIVMKGSSVEHHMGVPLCVVGVDFVSRTNVLFDVLDMSSQCLAGHVVLVAGVSDH